MVAGLSQRILRGPGRLIVGPTDLSDADLYGGTEVGLVKTAALVSLGSSFRIENESLGEATDILNAPKRWAFSCMLRGYDDDAVEKFLTDGTQAAGSVSFHRTFSVPGATVPGASALSRALILLFVPDDVLHVPSLLIYSGVPEWSEGSEMAWQHESELGIPLAVECMRNSSNNTLSIGMLADLSL